MVYDLAMLKAFYTLYEGKIERIRTILQRPLTLAEKILYAHLYDEKNVKDYKRGEDYVNFRPDRVAMQDATAQMALLQFMNAGRDEVAVPSTVHCDHLIQAYKGAKEDIATATKTNEEVYNFLRDVSSRYGIGFWQPGAGIIHQVVLENYAFPGGMIIVTNRRNERVEGLSLYIQFLKTVFGMFLMKRLPSFFYRFHSLSTQKTAVRQADNLLTCRKQTYGFLKQHIEIRY